MGKGEGDKNKMSELSSITAIVGVVATIVSLVIVALRFERRLGNMDKDSVERYGDINTRLQGLEIKILPFWELIKGNLPRLLSPNPTKDILDKIERAETLSLSELIIIERKLRDDMGKVPINERVNFLLVLCYVRSIIKAKENSI